MVICRICLASTENSDQSMSIYSYTETLLFENLLVKDAIEKCAPEVDLEVSDNPVICTTCYDLLILSYTFKSRCWESEKKINFYIDRNNLMLEDKLDLKNVLNMENDLCHQDVDDCFTEEVDLSHQDVDDCFTEEVDLTIDISDTSDVHSDSEEINIIDSDSDTDKWRNTLSNETTERPPSYSLRKGYSCDKCEYRTYKKDLLRNHKRKKCKNTIRHKCNLCDYTTYRKSDLIRHELIHRDKRRYVCGLCDKGFNKKRGLRKHIFEHTGSTYIGAEFNPDLRQTYQKPFVCKLCNRNFLKQTEWNQHMEHQHEIYFNF